MYDTLFKNLQSMMLGEMTAEEVLKNAETCYQDKTRQYIDDSLKRLFFLSVHTLTPSLFIIGRTKYLILPITILSLVFAAFLAYKMQNKAGGFLRSIMFIPVIASAVTAGKIWGVIHRP